MKRLFGILLSLIICLAPLSVFGVSQYEIVAFRALIEKQTQLRQERRLDFEAAANENAHEAKPAYDSAFIYYTLTEEEFLSLPAELPLENQKRGKPYWCLPEVSEKGSTAKRSLYLSEDGSHARLVGDGEVNASDLVIGKLDIDQKLIDAFRSSALEIGIPISLQIVKVSNYIGYFLVLNAQDASFALYFSESLTKSDNAFDFWKFYPLSEAQASVVSNIEERNASYIEAEKPKTYPLKEYSVAPKEEADFAERLESVRTILSEQKQELDLVRDGIYAAFEKDQNVSITEEQLDRARRLIVSDGFVFSRLSEQERLSDHLSDHSEREQAIWQTPCMIEASFSGSEEQKEGVCILYQNGRGVFSIIELHDAPASSLDQFSDQEILDAVSKSELLHGNVTGIYRFYPGFYRAVFVYLTGPDGEFLIAFPDEVRFEEEKLPIECGRLYALEELRVLFADYDASHFQSGDASDESSGGGGKASDDGAYPSSVANAESKTKFNPLMSALVGLFAGALTGAVIPIKEKEKQSS